ncbi:hypothetical protein [Salmonella enterica]|uniref:hypothetical protein n=1 Tax=Salmonella enterica TaxID=28901 RepID=UPI002024E266|nr:hypothetical protein [Salmonella enterica]
MQRYPSAIHHPIYRMALTVESVGHSTVFGGTDIIDQLQLRPFSVESQTVYIAPVPHLSWRPTLAA